MAARGEFLTELDQADTGMDAVLTAEALGAAIAVISLLVGFVLGRYERRGQRNSAIGASLTMTGGVTAHEHQWGVHREGETFWRCQVCGERGPEIPGAKVQ